MSLRYVQQKPVRLLTMILILAAQPVSGWTMARLMFNKGETLLQSTPSDPTEL